MIEGSTWPDSVIGRLLQEISWSGENVRAFRNGGRGREDVLTAEVLLALDFLPRRAFLGSVVAASTGAAEARAALVAGVESASVTLLPDQLQLTDLRGEQPVAVQPDGLLTTSDCYVLLEAKRIRASSFQREQLARELVAVVRESGRRSPLLFLLLGSGPPIRVRGIGRVSLRDAVAAGFESLSPRLSLDLSERGSLLDRLDDVVAWTTWDQLAATLLEQRSRYPAEDASGSGCVNRLVDSVLASLARHA